MTFWKSFDVQLGFNYRSAYVTVQSRGDFRMGVGTPDLQGRQLANYTFDAGLKKDFFKKSLTLTLRVSDIFNTNKSQTITEASDYYANIKRWSDSRVIYFGVSYRINKGIKARKKIQRQDEIQEDIDY